MIAIIITITISKALYVMLAVQVYKLPLIYTVQQVTHHPP